MKLGCALLLLFMSTVAVAQELTGALVLERAIQYHDPSGNWATFNDSFVVTMTTPSQPVRTSTITINLPEAFFKVAAVRNGIETTHVVNQHINSVTTTDLHTNEVTSSTDPAAINRAVFMRDYYTYLYGLPMKLTDAGTIINDVVVRKQFKGKEYLVLEARYDAGVGTDVWYFYFDPITYAMEVYQFYRTGAIGAIDTTTGEYILLTGTAIINSIKMPASRAWYYNKDDRYLGTDVLVVD